MDYDNFSVTRGGLTTLVRPVPISVDPQMVADFAPPDLAREERRIPQPPPAPQGADRRGRRPRGLYEGDSRTVSVDRLLTLHPDMKGKFTLVQIGSPSRVHIPAYRRLNDELDALVDDINWRQGNGSWPRSSSSTSTTRRRRSTP